MLALVLAMSGGALAASHYLINSTRQISPKVLTKLKGNTGQLGATGATGAAGAAGPSGGTKIVRGAAGPEGPEGLEGPEGPQGPEGPEGKLERQTSLAPGESESGFFAVGSDNGASSGTIATAVTFPIRLPESRIDVEYVTEYFTEKCPGRGEAEAGYLCIYSGYQGVLLPGTVRSLEGDEFSGETGRGGFELQRQVTAPDAEVSGEYTVRAPD
jgi:hypothetical protein